MHIYVICVWCTKWQEGLVRMVCALTRVANEVPVLVELTQPRIHCITVENNGMRFFLLSLSQTFLLHPLPFYSGSIFRFAFSSSSLSEFSPRMWQFLPHICLRSSQQISLLLLLHDVYFHFMSDRLSCVDYRFYGIHSLLLLNFHISYRIENYF